MPPSSLRPQSKSPSPDITLIPRLPMPPLSETNPPLNDAIRRARLRATRRQKQYAQDFVCDRSLGATFMLREMLRERVRTRLFWGRFLEDEVDPEEVADNYVDYDHAPQKELEMPILGRHEVVHELPAHDLRGRLRDIAFGMTRYQYATENSDTTSSNGILESAEDDGDLSTPRFISFGSFTSNRSPSPKRKCSKSQQFEEVKPLDIKRARRVADNDNNIDVTIIGATEPASVVDCDDERMEDLEGKIDLMFHIQQDELMAPQDLDF